MRMLVVHPGAEFSLPQVYDGYVKGLRKQGVEVIPYRLDGRIHVAASRLAAIWDNRPPEQSDLVAPTWSDVVYEAGRDILEMAWKREVDWVLVISGVYLHHELMENFDRPRPWKVGFVFTESPYFDGMQSEWGPHVDMCWTNDLASVERLRAYNPATYYLPTAYDAEVHKPGVAPAAIPAHDVVFVGAGLNERIELLEAVDWTGIDLGLYGRWQLLRADSPLRPFLRQGTDDEVFDNNTVVTDLYRKAKIGLNLYRESIILSADAGRIGGGYSLNPRAYELAAVRAFQLSEHRPEVPEVFGDAVPYFFNAQELQAQLRYYLEHPEERNRLAYAAHKKVQRHSYDERAHALLDHIGQTAPTQRSELIAVGGVSHGG